MSTRETFTPGAGPAARPGGDSGGVADEARHQTAEMKEKAGEMKDKAREKVEDVQEQARAKGEEIRDRVERTGERQKDRAAGTADALAEAIRAASSTLRERDEARLGDMTDEFADQIERFSGYLRENDMRGLMHNLEDVARRNPTGFLGSTLAAGLVAGRFLRSSARDTESSMGSQRDRESSAPQHRPPSHQEFASNSPTPELNKPREAAVSSSPPRTTPATPGPTNPASTGRDSSYSAGGPRP